ncbi:MAG TPA: hypothetical protein VIK66_08275 [Gaiellaceae bacterium]|jgi:hypothetical protein
MSEHETRKDEDDVEAHHGRGGHKLANDEGSTEGETEDFEAHRGGHHKLANDEGSSDSDDFELHRGGHHKLANDEGSSEDDDDFELHKRRL